MAKTRKSRPEDSDPEFKRIKAEVIKRDKYTCQLCDKRRRRSYLNVHHIVPYSKSVYLRTDKNNLVTLCVKCHKSIKNNEARYIVYFTNKVLGKK